MFDRKTIKQCVTGAAAAVMMTATFGAQALAASNDAPWKIQEVSGEARFLDQAKGAQAASAGTIIDAGDRVETGADGRVVLARGEERITISPSSEMGLPVENDGPYSTRILQNLGTILLRVQKQPNQHFEVKTPYMAAVVKGTTFTVSVSEQGAAVHVVEGAVQVADLAGQQVQLIRPGQTATRSSNSGAAVTVTGVGTTPAGKPDKAAVDSPADTSDDAKAAPGSNGNAAAVRQGGPKGDGPGNNGKGKGGPKIAKALGSLNLNVAAATNGLATGPGNSANAGQGKGNGKGKGTSQSGGTGFAPAVANVPVGTLVAQATGNNGNGNANGNGNSDNGSTENGNGGGNANGNANGGGNGGGNANGNANGGGNGGGNGNGNANGN